MEYPQGINTNWISQLADVESESNKECALMLIIIILPFLIVMKRKNSNKNVQYSRQYYKIDRSIIFSILPHKILWLGFRDVLTSFKITYRIMLQLFDKQLINTCHHKTAMI